MGRCSGAGTLTNPDTQPCLPPRQANFKTGRSNHPCVDIERVGNPEIDEGDVAPLPACRLDRLQVMVGQEELLAGQPRLRSSLLSPLAVEASLVAQLHTSFCSHLGEFFSGGGE